MRRCFLGPKGCEGPVLPAPPAPDVPWAAMFRANTHYCEAHRSTNAKSALNRMGVPAAERQRQWLASEGLA